MYHGGSWLTKHNVKLGCGSFRTVQKSLEGFSKQNPFFVSSQFFAISPHCDLVLSQVNILSR